MKHLHCVTSANETRYVKLNPKMAVLACKNHDKSAFYVFDQEWPCLRTETMFVGKNAHFEVNFFSNIDHFARPN